MRKFYTEPSMNVSMFEAENLLTASAATGTSTTESVENLEKAYAVKTIDAGTAVSWTF